MLRHEGRVESLAQARKAIARFSQHGVQGSRARERQESPRPLAYFSFHSPRAESLRMSKDLGKSTRPLLAFE
jgi:hypothetical protein